MLKLRSAVPADVPLMLDYVRELAEYERAPEKVVARSEDLERYVFGEQPLAFAVMAEWDGQPAGWAIWFYNFSTWEGRPGLYLEDLYVRPALRGHGIGKALLKHLARVALEKGCTRYVWQVLDWNTPSLEFYKAMGATVLEEWLTCRVEGEPLRRLALGAPALDDRGTKGATTSSADSGRRSRPSPDTPPRRPAAPRRRTSRGRAGASRRR
jgi:GNAT superfamily N-acetyltransferase